MGSLPTFNLHPPTSSSRTHFYVCIATRAYIYIYIPTLVSKSWFFFQRACTRVRACVCVYQQPARPCRATGVCGCVGCASLFLCRLPLFSQPTEINLYSFSSSHIYFLLILVSSIVNSLHSSTFCYLCLYKKILNCETKMIESWTPTIIASRWTCVHLKCTAHVPQTRSAVCTNTVGPSALFCLPVIQG